MARLLRIRLRNPSVSAKNFPPRRRRDAESLEFLGALGHLGVCTRAVQPKGAFSKAVEPFSLPSGSSAETAEHAENCLTWSSSASLCLGGEFLSTDYGRLGRANAGLASMV